MLKTSYRIRPNMGARVRVIYKYEQVTKSRKAAEFLDGIFHDTSIGRRVSVSCIDISRQRRSRDSNWSI